MLFLADQAMIFVVPAVMALVLGLRYGLHVMDKGRITEAARAKGWQDVTVQWAPFAANRSSSRSTQFSTRLS